MTENAVAHYGWRTEQATHSTGYIAPRLLDLLAALKVRRVADLGAGNGALCGLLAARGFDVTGIEYDADGVRIARQAHPGVRFHQFGVQDDPALLLQTESPFDAVISTEVIEHLFSPHLLPRYAAQVLRDDGWLLVSTPYHGYLKNLALSLTGRWDHHHTALWHGGHIKFWSRRTLAALLEQNGFVVTGFCGVGRLPYLWKSMIMVARKTSPAAASAPARPAGWRQVAKTVLHRVAPGAFGALMARRSNRFARRVLERDGIPALLQAYVAAHGLRVAAGPFAGMRYVDASVGSVLIPKLLGSYESELHPALESLLAQPCSAALDVGCAEGYYSVGLALRLPAGTPVHAWDTDPGARRACAALAALNGVAARVQLGAFCDPPALARTLDAAAGREGRALVICDCEGYEDALLDPAQVPALAQANLLVELHEQARPGVTSRLQQRFAATHHVELVDAQPRTPADWPALQCLPADRRARAVSEYRGGPQQWAVMRPRDPRG